MPDIDYSFLDDDLLIELSQLELDDYIIDLAWSSNGENLAAITVEGNRAGRFSENTRNPLKSHKLCKTA